MNTYYVKCKGSYGDFFSFQDGHFTASDFRNASGTNSLEEAIRMYNYALTLDPLSKIVYVSLNIKEIDNHDQQIADHTLKVAREKLSNKEFSMLREQWFKTLDKR